MGPARARNTEAAEATGASASLRLFESLALNKNRSEMAAPFMSEVAFEECLPLIDTVIRAVTSTTGMVINCQAAGVDGGLWRLSNQKAGMAIDLMPDVERLAQKYTYCIFSDPFNKWNPYLHETLVFVLLKLGGKSEDQLPVWAGQPWLIVQKEWNPGYLKGLEAWYKR